MNPRHLTATIALAATALLAACGGGEQEELAANDTGDDLAVVALALPRPTPSAPGATQVVLSGRIFQVRSGAGGPGPNAWSNQNVWVDSKGLHLKIAQRDGQWSCAEVYMTQPLGFGTYQFKIAGNVGALDRNVVLGLFNYPTPDVGPDGTNEIDIEFATWGGVQPQHGNWTVWPAAAGPDPTTHAFTPVLASGGQSTQRFTWTASKVVYQTAAGFTNRGVNATWTFAPPNPATLIPQKPLPLHMNLWLFRGEAPSDGKEVEIVISEFTFAPAKLR